MRHLRNIQRQGQIASGGGKQGLIGVIYMSWQRFGLAEAGGSILFREHWRLFAEREAEAVFKSSVLFDGIHWMHDDMFIHMRLPSGRTDLLESWLLETAYKHAKDWEIRFGELLAGHYGGQWNGKLSVGIAIAEIGETAEEELAWYETVKQAMLHGQSDGGMERSLMRKALGQILEQRCIDSVYQPIMRTSGDKVFGYEALTRLRELNWFDGPLALFSFAEAEGSAYALDRIAREKAIGGCGSLSPDQKLFINLNAQIMDDPGFSPGQTLSLLEQRGLSPRNVVFELTERNSIEDFGSVKKALEHYRSQGYQIAIDDVGAGYSSLQSIVELRPDYLKVDRSIIQNIHLDDIKSHMLHSLTQMADKMGISIIAEGIEQEAELAKVKEMGVPYAQGYLLGRPAAFP